MKWRHIMVLVVLAGGFTLVELRSVAQAQTSSLGNLLQQLTGQATQVPTTPTQGPTDGAGGAAGTAGGGGTAGTAGIAGTGGTAATAGTGGTAGTAGTGGSVVGPVPPLVPPLGERTETALPGPRNLAGRTAFTAEQTSKRTRASYSGTVKPGQGLANQNKALAAQIPPKHTVESVLAGRETTWEMLAFNFMTAALDSAVTNLAGVLGVLNPWDYFFGSIVPTVVAVPDYFTPFTAGLEPVVMIPPSIPASKSIGGKQSGRDTALPTGRSKIRLTPEQMLEVQSLMEYSNTMVSEVLDILLPETDPLTP